MQNDFVLPNMSATISGAYKTLPKIKQLLDFFRRNKLPVIHVIRTYKSDFSNVEITRINEFKQGNSYAVEGTKGCEIIDELKPLNHEKTVIKNRFSAFMDTTLKKTLEEFRVTNMIICGTQYPTCIRATAMDGIAYDYHVTVAIDATSAANNEIADANIIDLKNMGVHCLNVNEIVAGRLVEQLGGPCRGHGAGRARGHEGPGVGVDDALQLRHSKIRGARRQHPEADDESRVPGGQAREAAPPVMQRSADHW